MVGQEAGAVTAASHAAPQGDTLGDAYPREQARCRELLAVYRDLGPIGAFGAAMIERTLAEADKAATAGDVAEMVRAFREMQGCK